MRGLKSVLPALTAVLATLGIAAKMLGWSNAVELTILVPLLALVALQLLLYRRSWQRKRGN